VQTQRLLREAGDPNRPPPTTKFKEHHLLEFGNDRLELVFHGPNHSPDNIFIYAPRHRALMVVDVFFPGWVPFKSLGVSQDIPAWVRAHDIAMDYGWTTLVAGHLGRLGVRADGELQRQYIRALDANVKQTMTSLDPTPFFQQYGHRSLAGPRAYASHRSHMRGQRHATRPHRSRTDLEWATSVA
jgi:glyoxylase-like metal-dependent hydrolase (beta-lactamase superfamily II)